MYKCQDCLEIFDEPKKYCDDCTPGGVFEGGSFMNYYSACPYCAGNYEEADECDNCGKVIFTTEGKLINGNFLCKDCLKKEFINKDDFEAE